MTAVPDEITVASRRRRDLFSVLARLRTLHGPAITLPVVGEVHAPGRHDVIYIAGVGVLVAVGAVEWPIALAVVGGHALVKQNYSRSLSSVGKAMEDVLGR